MLWQPRLLDMGLQQGWVLRELSGKGPDNVRNYKDNIGIATIDTDLSNEILPIFKAK